MIEAILISLGITAFFVVGVMWMDGVFDMVFKSKSKKKGNKK